VQEPHKTKWMKLEAAVRANVKKASRKEVRRVVKKAKKKRWIDGRPEQQKRFRKAKNQLKAYGETRSDFCAA